VKPNINQTKAAGSKSPLFVDSPGTPGLINGSGAPASLRLGAMLAYVASSVAQPNRLSNHRLLAGATVEPVPQ